MARLCTLANLNKRRTFGYIPVAFDSGETVRNSIFHVFCISALLRSDECLLQGYEV